MHFNRAQQTIDGQAQLDKFMRKIGLTRNSMNSCAMCVTFPAKRSQFGSGVARFDIPPLVCLVFGFGLVWFGLVWFGLVWLGPMVARLCFVWFVWFGWGPWLLGFVFCFLVFLELFVGLSTFSLLCFAQSSFSTMKFRG